MARHASRVPKGPPHLRRGRSLVLTAQGLLSSFTLLPHLQFLGRIMSLLVQATREGTWYGDPPTLTIGALAYPKRHKEARVCPHHPVLMPPSALLMGTNLVFPAAWGPGQHLLGWTPKPNSRGKNKLRGLGLPNCKTSYNL